MKKNLTFAEGFLGIEAEKARKNNASQKAFDWNKAAKIIKKKFETNKKLVAEAGLDGDWTYTKGIIFENGKATNENYTYLSSNWAVPTLLLKCGKKIEEIECWTEENENFNAYTKWNDMSLGILELPLLEE